MLETIKSYLPDHTSAFFYLVIALFVIAILYFNDMFSNMNTYRGYDAKKQIGYGYEASNGPNMWKHAYVDAAGRQQSPINLLTHCTITVPSELQSLKFSEEFSENPREMLAYNNGLNVVLYAKWCNNRRPNITMNCVVYNFLNIRFRWGPTDNEGSEHMVDTTRFAIEMQVAFIKNNSGCDILEAARNKDLLMVSYFFMATSVDNPYLEPIVKSLKMLKCPLSCASICPFPLKLLTPIFSKNYFSYEGSLTFPPCTEGVKWIVQPEPLLISSRQASKFRKLIGGCNCTRISSNSRPVQKTNEREIFFYD
ncbi:unnamed protein product [Ceutorhynchus assimilis]|uniref:Alpha-carbonic anhydrase domain-containing protein n=1 Tax=Ceutorhynchus assimilis TaxID=467358 RepID=A0A9N9QM09_9CUCU|nr:unnamed protein product [Ceutorhynchus assimilis]